MDAPILEIRETKGMVVWKRGLDAVFGCPHAEPETTRTNQNGL